ncbi:hypothetical protein QOT17_004111 [Balamuthia mandrillaris]
MPFHSKPEDVTQNAIQEWLAENEVRDPEEKRALLLQSVELGTLPVCSLCSLHITWLVLEDAHIHTIPPEINCLCSLEGLRLGRNRLKTLPKEITCLNKLLVLDLDHNCLCSLPHTIHGLSNLQCLHLRGNSSLRCLPCSILQLRLSEFTIDELTTKEEQFLHSFFDGCKKRNDSSAIPTYHAPNDITPQKQEEDEEVEDEAEEKESKTKVWTSYTPSSLVDLCLAHLACAREQHMAKEEEEEDERASDIAFLPEELKHSLQCKRKECHACSAPFFNRGTIDEQIERRTWKQHCDLHDEEQPEEENEEEERLCRVLRKLWRRAPAQQFCFCSLLGRKVLLHGNYCLACGGSPSAV